MITAFELNHGRLQQVTVESLEDLQHCHPVWVDFESPTEEERDWAKTTFQIDLPEEDEVGDIEASARFFEEENGELHIRSDFFQHSDEDSDTMRVAFILKAGMLFSIRRDEMAQFRLLRLRARRQPYYVSDEKDVLLQLLDIDVEYSADIIEGIYDRLDKFSKQVLGSEMSDDAAGIVLSGIAVEEDLNGRIRRNLMDTRRAVSFLMRVKLLNEQQNDEGRQILRDIDSLDGHTGFVFDKLNFLMDATVGFININQNRIIKIFSVASVAMLPPTLIASIYGMNFRFLPELDWEYGYPFSLTLMAISIAVPFWYFHKKGWLKK